MAKESDEMKSSKIGWVILSVLALLIVLTFLWGHSLQKQREAARQEAEQRAVIAQQARDSQERESKEHLARLERIAQQKLDYERKRDERRDRADEMRRIKEETAEKIKAARESFATQRRIADSEASIKRSQLRIEALQERTDAIRNGR